MLSLVRDWRGVMMRAHLPEWLTGLAVLASEGVFVQDDRLFVEMFETPDGVARAIGVVTRLHAGISAKLRAFVDLGTGRRGWGVVHAAARFGGAPGPDTLAEALRIVADDWDAGYEPDARYSRKLPWPLAACLLSAGTADGLRRLAERAVAGRLGDMADWESAEKRWSEVGLTAADWDAISEDAWPFDERIADTGCAFAAIDRSSPMLTDLFEFDPLYAWYSRFPAGPARALAAALCIRWLQVPPIHYEDRPHLSPGEWRELLADAPDIAPGLPLLDDAESGGYEFPDWADLLESLGTEPQARGLPPVGAWKRAAAVAHAFAADPTRTGLLVVMGWLVPGGVPFPVPDALLEDCLIAQDAAGTAALLLRLSHGGWDHDTATKLGGAAAAHARRKPSIAHLVGYVLWHHPVRPSERRAFLLAMLDAVPEPARDTVLGLAVRALGEESSGLAEPDTWRAAGLPGWVR